MAKDPGRIVILGAGPTGLGAAWRLAELGYTDWELFEAADHPGGLASSFVDDCGFTWDLGGHVIFSHYEYFDELLDAVLGREWVEHPRESWIWMRERFIPYPLQNNIWRLPREDLVACLEGLVNVNGAGEMPKPADFGQWIDQTFGEGLARTFMRPYNFKVWAHDPSQMDWQWVGDRVATVDLKRVLSNLVHERDDVGWGPNSTFRFPLRGGTGCVWQSIADRLPQDRVRFGSEVVAVDCRRKTIRLATGEERAYDFLISTLPLDVLLKSTSGLAEIAPLGDGFKHSSLHVIGVGAAGRPPEHLRSKCWIYFPEPDVPFHRLTVFSNYSPNNVPKPDEQWSLMVEVSESTHKPVDAATVAEEAAEAMRRLGLIPAGSEVVTVWHRRLEYAYPTPFLGRNELLGRALGGLKEAGIYSRGRFGAWKYEVGNMDHSVMQGVEAVDSILLGESETTVERPNVVNSPRYRGQRPVRPAGEWGPS